MCGFVFWFRFHRFWCRLRNLSKGCKRQVDMPVCYMESFDWLDSGHNHQRLCQCMCGFVFWYRNRMFLYMMMNLSKGCKQQVDIFECYKESFDW